MKYRIGDEVLVKAKIESLFNENLYFAKCSVSSFYVTEEDMESPMTAEEAWEIAKKILLYPAHGGFNATELEEIFGRTEHLWELTPQEAKAKIEAWETEKEIKVGDIVRPKTTKEREYMVTYISESRKLAGVCLQTGEVIPEAFEVSADSVVKTGRHIDIAGILNQIGGTDA